jgi:DNA-binding MarR family transcriptional regulator
MTMSTTNATEQLARELEGLAHPVRLRVVLAIGDEQSSPTALAARLSVPLGTLSYHVRCLAAIGLLKLVAQRPRRGALEHIYELTTRGRALRAVALDLMRA